MITSTMIEEAQQAALTAFADAPDSDLPADAHCIDVTEAQVQNLMGDFDIERQSGMVEVRHQVEVAFTTIRSGNMCAGCAVRAAVFMGFLMGVLAARAEAEDTY